MLILEKLKKINSLKLIISVLILICIFIKIPYDSICKLFIRDVHAAGLWDSIYDYIIKPVKEPVKKPFSFFSHCISNIFYTCSDMFSNVWSYFFKSGGNDSSKPGDDYDNPIPSSHIKTESTSIERYKSRAHKDKGKSEASEDYAYLTPVLHDSPPTTRRKLLLGNMTANVDEEESTPESGMSSNEEESNTFTAPQVINLPSNDELTNQPASALSGSDEDDSKLPTKHPENLDSICYVSEDDNYLHSVEEDKCTAVLFGNTQENTTVNNIPEETEINVVDFTKLNYESLCAILLRDNLTHELDPDTRSFIEDLVEAAEVTSEEEGYRNFSMAYHGDSIPSSSSSSSIPSSRSILPSSSSSSTRP